MFSTRAASLALPSPLSARVASIGHGLASRLSRSVSRATSVPPVILIHSSEPRPRALDPASPVPSAKAVRTMVTTLHSHPVTRQPLARRRGQSRFRQTPIGIAQKDGEAA